MQVSSISTLFFNNSISKEQITIQDTTIYPLTYPYYFAGFWRYTTTVRTPTGNIITSSSTVFNLVNTPFSYLINIEEGGLYELTLSAIPVLGFPTIASPTFNLNDCFFFANNIYKCIVSSAVFVVATEELNISNGEPVDSNFKIITESELTSNFVSTTYQIYTEPIKQSILKKIGYQICDFKQYICSTLPFCKNSKFLNMYKLISCYYNLNDIIVTVTSDNIENVRSISNLANYIMRL